MSLPANHRYSWLVPLLRRFLVALAIVAIVSSALFLVDAIHLRYYTREALTIVRSQVTDDDRMWWQANVGALPTPTSREAAIPVPTDGASGLQGNFYHPDGGDGADGASINGADLDDPTFDGFRPFEAFELRLESNKFVVRGRVLSTSELCAYRLELPGPFDFREHFCIVPATTSPGAPAESALWTSRPKLSRFVLPNLAALAVAGMAFLVLARPVKALRRRLAIRDAAVKPSLAAIKALLNSDACTRCGYDNRGAAIAACPECGVTLGDPLTRWRLSFADPRWLRRIKVGRACLSAGLHLALFAALVAIVLFFTGYLLSHFFTTFVVEAIDWLLWAVNGGVAIAAVGAWLMSTRDGRDALRLRRWRPRTILRVALVSGISALVLQSLAPTLSSFPGMRPLVMAASLVSAIVRPLALPAAMFGLVGLIEELAARIPAARLIDRCRVQRRWILALAPVLLVAPLASVAWFAWSGTTAALRPWSLLWWILSSAIYVEPFVLVVLVAGLCGILRAFRSHWNR